ncbi:MAG: hypothetical protein RIS10_1472 [Pseudomonadota bacterium]
MLTNHFTKRYQLQQVLSRYTLTNTWTKPLVNYTTLKARGYN